MPSKTLPPKPRSIAAKKTISIVASLYNEDLVNTLLDSTVHGLRTLIPGITVNIYRVPGAFEIPVCVKKIIESKKYDVIGIDNLNSYYIKKLKIKRLSLLKKQKLKFYKIDLMEKNKLNNLFKKYTTKFADKGIFFNY